MTKENEIKLLKEIARSHFGDLKFEKKWGINLNIYEDVSSNENEISDEKLELMYKTYEEMFISVVSKKLDEESLLEEFFYDLVYGGCSMPRN